MAGARNQEAAQRRRRDIVALVRTRGAMPVAELGPRFAVSPATIRRDLRRLEDGKAVVREYGTVRPAESGAFETPLSYRADNLREEKGRIADEVARRIGDARTVFLDEGYLPIQIARAMPAGPRTVVTTSLPAAMALAERPEVQVIVVGGRLRRRTLGTVDQWAVDMLRGLAPDLAVIGANAVDAAGWVTTPDPAVAAVKSAALASSARRLFAGSHDKFGHSTFARFAQVGDFEAMVTGRELPPSHARVLAALGARIVRV